MVEERTTLLFRHLPRDLSEDERKELLHHLGATQARVFGQHGPMKNTAFAVFKTEEQAKEVVSQLHQVEFLGSTLVVEFAKPHKDKALSYIDKEGTVPNTQLAKDAENNDNKAEATESSVETKLQQPKAIKFDRTFHTWGLHHPRRPDLYYQYPPPTPSTLTNILHALAAVPKFYVQVLHLMNKMDLPAPFGMVTPAPPVYSDIPLPSMPVPDDVGTREMEISSSAESELESDGGEEAARPKKSESRAKKDLLKRRPVKRQRLTDLKDHDIVTPIPSTLVQVPVSEIFETSSEGASSAKKIALKIPTAISVQPTMQPQTNLSRVEPIAHKDPLRPLHPYSLQHAATTKPQEGLLSKGGGDLYDPLFPLPVPALTPSSTGDVSSHVQRLNSGDASSRSSYVNPLDVTLPPALPRPPPSSAENRDTEMMYGPHPPPKAPDMLNSGVDVSGQSISDLKHPLDNRTSDEHAGSVGEVMGGFGILQPVQKAVEDTVETEEAGEKEWTKGKFVSSSQLKRGRLSRSEREELSVFRRYAEGEPSCRLYIKNLAKQISEEDLHWIYGRYVDWNKETETNVFDIRLMKEGRMKGQAFVTLPSEKVAIEALHDTNGYLMKDKPMVVQFARSAKAEEDKASKVNG